MDNFAPMRLKYLRERVGLSRQQLGDAVGVTRQCVHYWEQGKWVPSANYLPALVQALDCDLTDLYVRREAIAPVAPALRGRA
jgi:DNA-binding XRE family transcriptional regulator